MSTETPTSPSPAVSPTRTTRTIDVTCPSCEQVVYIDRALMVTCPDCGAGPGVSCIDMRARKGLTKARVAVHPARSKLLVTLP